MAGVMIVGMVVMLEIPLFLLMQAVAMVMVTTAMILLGNYLIAFK
jgi:hypothetical protein